MASSTINFVGSPRKLKYILSAVRKFKVANGGIPLWKVRLPDSDGIAAILDGEVLTRVVWAGLLHEDPKLDFATVEALLEKYLEVNADDGLESVYGSVAAAFDESGLFGLKLKKEKSEEPTPTEKEKETIHIVE